MKTISKKKYDHYYELCIERCLMKDGTIEIHCKLGLWGVSGINKDRVEREAKHYWAQYYRDGEYDGLLS